MPLGDPSNDIVTLNVDSLWSGGPFQDLVGVFKLGKEAGAGHGSRIRGVMQLLQWLDIFQE